MIYIGMHIAVLWVIVFAIILEVRRYQKEANSCKEDQESVNQDIAKRLKEVEDDD